MDFLIQHLKSIGSEYQITSSDGNVFMSEKFDDIVKTKPVATNIYNYENNFYDRFVRNICVNGISYNVVTLSNVTRYAKEIIKSKTDCLTKLPNRMQLQEYLSNLKEESVIVMCDIDNFKKVNDSFGHQIGDVVITLLGDLIRTIIDKEEDFAGRYGGEEFLIVFNTNDVYRVKLIMDQFNDFLNKYSKQLDISVSSGIYRFDPKKEHVLEAVKKADEAMYFVKQHGKKAAIVYDDIKKYNK